LKARFREARGVVSLTALREELTKDSRAEAIALAERCARRMETASAIWPRPGPRVPAL
jgi:hypothetical protein